MNTPFNNHTTWQHESVSQDAFSGKYIALCFVHTVGLWSCCHWAATDLEGASSSTGAWDVVETYITSVTITELHPWGHDNSS